MYFFGVVVCISIYQHASTWSFPSTCNDRGSITKIITIFSHEKPSFLALFVCMFLISISFYIGVECKCGTRAYIIHTLTSKWFTSAFAIVILRVIIEIKQFVCVLLMGRLTRSSGGRPFEVISVLFCVNSLPSLLHIFNYNTLIVRALSVWSNFESPVIFSVSVPCYALSFVSFFADMTFVMVSKISRRSDRLIPCATHYESVRGTVCFFLFVGSYENGSHLKVTLPLCLAHTSFGFVFKKEAVRYVWFRRKFTRIDCNFLSYYRTRSVNILDLIKTLGN